MLNVYDEQLQAAEKAFARRRTLSSLPGLLRTQWHRPLSGERARMAHSQSESCRLTLVARDVSRGRTLARCEPQADAHVCRTSTLWAKQYENLVLTGPTGVGKTGLRLRSSARRLCRTATVVVQFVRAQGSVLDEMYAGAGRPIHRDGYRIWLARLDVLLVDVVRVFKSGARKQSNTFFKLDGGTLPPSLDASSRRISVMT